MDHPGNLQAGGVESGEPWVGAVAQLTDDSIAFVVNGKNVGDFARSGVMLTLDGEVYRLVASNETLFFRPDDLTRFQLDLKEEKSAADKIALASSAPRAVPKRGEKSKVAAGVLGILLGGIGAHKFYLGNIGMGILYLIFFWTAIPALVGLIEGILYLTMSDAEFASRYG